MEISTEAWRVKHPRHWIPVKHVKGDENVRSKAREEDQKKKPKDTPKEEKRKKDFTFCFLARRKKFIPLPHQPSLVSLAELLNDSCCQCCHILADYFKEVIRVIYCVLNCRIPCMQFEALFCDLLDATGAMCADLFRFVRAFLKVCVGSKDVKKR